MPKLCYVPTDNLEERNNTIANNLYVRGFEKYGFDWGQIEGRNLTTKIETGAFLDANSTMFYKACQMAEIALMFNEKTVKEGDVFFIEDIWAPGIIPAIRYMSHFNNIPVKICGNLHAGSFTDTDFVAPMKHWAQMSERGWFNACDKIFVGSKFTFDDVIAKNRVPQNWAHKKIIVTGFAFDTEHIKEKVNNNIKMDKQDVIIFPTRFHWEKGADTFLEMAQIIGDEYPNVRFDITGGGYSERKSDKPWIMAKYRAVKKQLGEKRLRYIVNLDKTMYYQILNEASIVWSSALQENFGISILESMALGVIPVLPNRCSYPYLYPKDYLYDNFDEGLDRLRGLLDRFSDENWKGRVIELRKEVIEIAEKHNDNWINIMNEIKKLLEE